MNLENATLEQIGLEIQRRYEHQGNHAGIAVFVTDREFIIIGKEPKYFPVVGYKLIEAWENHPDNPKRGNQ